MFGEPGIFTGPHNTTLCLIVGDSKALAVAGPTGGGGLSVGHAVTLNRLTEGRHLGFCLDSVFLLRVVCRGCPTRAHEITPASR